MDGFECGDVLFQRGGGIVADEGGFCLASGKRDGWQIHVSVVKVVVPSMRNTNDLAARLGAQVPY